MLSEDHHQIPKSLDEPGNGIENVIKIDSETHRNNVEKWVEFLESQRTKTIRWRLRKIQDENEREDIFQYICLRMLIKCENNPAFAAEKGKRCEAYLTVVCRTMTIDYYRVTYGRKGSHHLEIWSKMKTESSFETPMDESGQETSVWDLLPSSEATGVSGVRDILSKSAVTVFDKLSPRDKAIIQAVANGEKLRVISADHGISESRVSQVAKKFRNAIFRMSQENRKTEEEPSTRELGDLLFDS